jgi:patatin-like phospholipase/acyl hydrolase
MTRQVFRILTLDGGGIRGFFTARLLCRIESARPGWLDRVDLIAGTSTGSIIAFALARGMAAGDIAAIYEKSAARIFSTSLRERLLDAGGLIGPRYDVRRLAAVLRQVFHDLRLRDLDRKVLVPAFNLDDGNPEASRRRWKPKIFHNFPGPTGDPGALVRQVALYSSAVPVVFAPVDGYIDGGVFAANPTLCAVAQTQDRRSLALPPRFDDLRVLSLGTGKSPLHIPERSVEWGMVQWAKPLLGLVLDAGVAAVDYQCRQLLDDRYHRLNPWLDGRPILLDDIEALPLLRQAAEATDLEPTLEWLDRAWSA